MGGRGSWAYQGGGGGSYTPPRPTKSGKGETSNELGIMMRGRNLPETLDNFARVIGNSKVEYSMVVDRNGNIIGDIYRGDSGSTSVDTRAAVRDRGSRTVHNHPDPYGFGGTFSTADLQFHANVGNDSMQATAREGTYLMQRTSTTDYRAFGRAYNKAAPGLEAEWQRKWAKISSSKKFKTPEARARAERQVFVGVYHRWFKDNAHKYGLRYTFAKGKGLSAGSSVHINDTYKDWYDRNRDY